LRQAGHNVLGLSDNEVIMRALTVSDMPIIAGEALQVSTRRSYTAAASPSAILAGSRTLPDFRAWTEALVDWTTLAMGKIGELGEYRSSFVDESGEAYSLFTIGGITGLSRQLYINGARALGNMAEQLGRRLAADVADRRIAYLEQSGPPGSSGPVMRDTGAVFSAAPAGRGNVLDLDTTDTGTVIDSALAARAAMAQRKGAGDVMIGQTPRYWLVPADFEPDAIRALAQVQAVEVGNTNPLAGQFQIVMEARLSDADKSYLVCAPASFDGLVQVGLEGAPAPYVESRWAFEYDALQVKIRLDIGFGWLEWRSWTRLDHAAAGG
jgi:hypothetical protein